MSPIQPRVVGHRGAAGHAPENTLPSFRAAAQLGVRWVEFDVNLTQDGHAVLLHDETLQRTTSVKGRLAETPRGDLTALDAGSWFDARFAGTRIPSLAEALDALEGLSLWPVVELKPSRGREAEVGGSVAAELARHWRERYQDRRPIWLSSFSPDALEAVRKAAPHLPRALLIHRLRTGWREDARRLGVAAIHANHEIVDAALAAEVKRRGLGLLAYTVNEPTRARTLFGLGVDGLFTGFPDRLQGL